MQAAVLAGLALHGADVEDPATLVAMDTALACAQALMVDFPRLHPAEAIGMVRQFIAQRACLLPDPPSA